MHCKVLFLLAAALLCGACNKEIDRIPVPPFSVAPNPCRGVLNFYPGLELQNGQQLIVTLYAPDGALLAKHIFIPASLVQPLNFALEKKGIHYIDVTLDDQHFQTEILNLQ